MWVAYIPDVNKVTYLGSVYSKRGGGGEGKGLIHGKCVNGILLYFNVILPCNIRNVVTFVS